MTAGTTPQNGRAASGRPYPRRAWLQRIPEQRLALLFVLPTLIFLLAMSIYPTLYAFWMSLRVELVFNPHASRFVGLDNFLAVFDDPFTVKSLWLTAIWSASVIAVQIVLGFLVALLLDTRLRGIGLLRSLLILPVFISPVAMGLTWRFMFEPVAGVINWALRSLHLPTGLWISSPKTALVSVLIADTWQWTPFVALILLAGIQSISPEIIEAARLDRVRGITYVRRIVLPLIRPVLIVVLVIRLIDSVRIFDLFYIMTRGGPGSSTLVSGVYDFTMFQLGRLSDMATLGIVILIIVNLLVTVFLRVLARQERQARRVGATA